MDYATAFFKALDIYGLKYRFVEDGAVEYLFDDKDIPEGFDGMIDSLMTGDFQKVVNA